MRLTRRGERGSGLLQLLIVVGIIALVLYFGLFGGGGSPDVTGGRDSMDEFQGALRSSRSGARTARRENVERAIEEYKASHGGHPPPSLGALEREGLISEADLDEDFDYDPSSGRLRPDNRTE